MKWERDGGRQAENYYIPVSSAISLDRAIKLNPIPKVHHRDKGHRALKNRLRFLVVGRMRLHCPSVGALNLNCITAAPPYTHFRENLRRPHLRIAGRKLELLFASNASRTVRGGPPLPQPSASVGGSFI